MVSYPPGSNLSNVSSAVTNGLTDDASINHTTPDGQESSYEVQTQMDLIRDFMQERMVDYLSLQLPFQGLNGCAGPFEGGPQTSHVFQVPYVQQTDFSYTSSDCAPQQQFSWTAHNVVHTPPAPEPWFNMDPSNVSYEPAPFNEPTIGAPLPLLPVGEDRYHTLKPYDNPYDALYNVQPMYVSHGLQQDSAPVPAPVHAPPPYPSYSGHALLSELDPGDVYNLDGSAPSYS